MDSIGHEGVADDGDAPGRGEHDGDPAIVQYAHVGCRVFTRKGQEQVAGRRSERERAARHNRATHQLTEWVVAHATLLRLAEAGDGPEVITGGPAIGTDEQRIAE